MIMYYYIWIGSTPGDIDLGFVGTRQLQEDVLLEPHGLVRTRKLVAGVPAINILSRWTSFKMPRRAAWSSGIVSACRVIHLYKNAVAAERSYQTGRTFLALRQLINRQLIDRQLINRQLIDRQLINYLFIDRQLIDWQLIDWQLIDWQLIDLL
jgi:hypothetical protein